MAPEEREEVLSAEPFSHLRQRIVISKIAEIKMAHEADYSD